MRKAFGQWLRLTIWPRGWQFSEAATVGAGLTLVPGTREWLQQSPWTVGVDRSMANLFFRPGFSPGFQSTGAVADGTLHYLAGVWNAIDGGSTGVLRRGTSMAWAGNIWWEPAGPFGYGASDMEVHADPVVRVGTSGVYALSLAQPLAGNNPEDTVVRLSDGTRLSEPGAQGARNRSRPVSLPARHDRRRLEVARRGRQLRVLLPAARQLHRGR